MSASFETTHDYGDPLIGGAIEIDKEADQPHLRLVASNSPLRIESTPGEIARTRRALQGERPTIQAQTISELTGIEELGVQDPGWNRLGKLGLLAIGGIVGYKFGIQPLAETAVENESVGPWIEGAVVQFAEAVEGIKDLVR